VHRLNRGNHHLLKSFVECGGDVATGIKTINRLRALLEVRQQLTLAIRQMHQLKRWQDESERAHRYARKIQKRKELNLDPRAGYVARVDSMRKEWLKFLVSVGELKKQLKEEKC